ncbi:hypothetical protein TYRP_008189 [Tyrophagus putrescentiae]|nr:hypothetical protein TYRP_008189 [Tyrophagus putrescentiae]
MHNWSRARNASTCLPLLLQLFLLDNYLSRINCEEHKVPWLTLLSVTRQRRPRRRMTVNKLGNDVGFFQPTAGSQLLGQ